MSERRLLRKYGVDFSLEWREHLRSYMVKIGDRHVGYIESHSGNSEWRWHTRTADGRRRVSGRHTFPSPFAALVAMTDSRTVIGLVRSTVTPPAYRPAGDDQGTTTTGRAG